MKKLFLPPLFFLFLLQTSAQSVLIDYQNYETVPNDPLKTRIYTLNNGLKVYMSVYKDAPRIQTLIAVKAGSKNDPKDATGLAHYLEHMLFKGTDKYGTLDYSKEEPQLQKIEDLYEVYRKTTDVAARKKIYREIDSISGVAAKFAIANEYDKMGAALGNDGTNAFTSFEETVYVNEIASNQLENFFTIEAERLRNPVMRIFHTELEAVYEEKNQSLDNDGDKVEDAMFEGLFKNHTYGTQTTIGTIEHLKNPSIKEIKKYFNANYIPNNMAIIMSGDFDPDKTIKLISEKFAYMTKREVPAFNFSPEAPITQPIVREVVGPEAESVSLAYRFGGATTSDPEMLKIISKILYNSKAGLFDLNLNKKQLVLESYAYEYLLKDYSGFFMGGYPKEGQNLVAVKDLLLAQLEELKKGNFPDWMLTSIINQMKLDRIRRLGSNYGRANAMLTAFVQGYDWKNRVEEIDRLSKITKQQVIDFAKKNFGNNYVLVYKKVGEDKNVQKVDKPQITPVEVNRDKQSPFLTAIVANTPPPIEPVFADYDKDIQKFKLKNGLDVNFYKNAEDETFRLYYIFNMGSKTDPMWPIAIRYLKFLGTDKYSPDAMSQEFYKIGCSFDVFSGDDRVYVSLSGLQENFEKGLELFEHLLSKAKPNDAALKSMIENILKERADEKLNKGAILYGAMVSYGKYGAQSPFTNVLPEAKLKTLKAVQLTDLIKKLESYQHRVLFYGAATTAALKISIEKFHPMQTPLPVPPMKEFKIKIQNDQVFVVDFDMKQAEIIMLSVGQKYSSALTPDVNLYNEYFGGGMSSIVFQDIRESKALAYNASSYFNSPDDKENFYINSAIIGTQADKLPEAMAGMMALLKNMPQSEVQFNTAKASVLQKMRTERTNKTGLLFDYEDAQKLGLKENIRKEIFGKVETMTMKDIAAFQEKNVKNMQYTTLVLGKKESLDIKTLEKYGKVTFLTLKDVFGF